MFISPIMNPYQLPSELARQLTSFDGTLASLDTFIMEVSQRLKRKRELIANHEKRFKKLLEQSHDGIALMDTGWKLTYVTSSVLKDFGYSEEELLNNNGDLKLGHPEETEKLKTFLEEMFRSPGKTKQICYRVKTKKGEWRWVRSNVTNLIEEPSIGALVFNYEDITEEMRLKREKEIERKNRDVLINSTKDLMWSLDKEMHLVTCNDAFKIRIKNTTGTEIKSGDVLLDPSIYPGDTLKKWEDRYNRALKGESFNVDDYFSSASIEMWEETRIDPIYQDNEIIGVACFLRDVTEKKVASELIRKSVETMGIAQNIAQFGSWECYFESKDSPEPCSLKLSNELCRIFGFDQREVTINFEDYFKLIHEEDKDYVKESIQTALANNSGFETEYRIINKNGEVRWLRSKARIIFNTNKPAKIVGTAQDITLRKSAENERNKLINDLIQRNKDLEQFAYIVSHNLRSPVAQILGLVNVLKSKENDPKTRLACIENLEKAAGRLDDVIFDLNEILQVRKQISERKATVNFKELVSEIEETLSPQLFKEKGFIACNFDSVDSFFTLKGYIYSIFYNLILNSLKYRKPDVPPLIEIRSGRVGNRITLSFKDNGIGIDMKNNKEKIFGLYKRFNTQVEGKGVGLYMVKMQVETLGGSITVNSEVNVGTEFRIEFECI